MCAESHSDSAFGGRRDHGPHARLLSHLWRPVPSRVDPYLTRAPPAYEPLATDRGFPKPRGAMRDSACRSRWWTVGFRGGRRRSVIWQASCGNQRCSVLGSAVSGAPPTETGPCGFEGPDVSLGRLGCGAHGWRRRSRSRSRSRSRRGNRRRILQFLDSLGQAVI